MQSGINTQLEKHHLGLKNGPILRWGYESSEVKMLLVQEIIIMVLCLSKSDLCGGVENNYSYSSHNLGGLSIDVTNNLLLSFQLLCIQFGGMGPCGSVSKLKNDAIYIAVQLHTTVVNSVRAVLMDDVLIQDRFSSLIHATTRNSDFQHIVRLNEPRTMCCQGMAFDDRMIIQQCINNVGVGKGKGDPVGF